MFRRYPALLCLPLAALLASCRYQPPSATGFTEISPSLAYTNQQLPKGPLSIHVVRVDRAAPDLEFHSTHAHGTSMGLSTLSEQVESLPQEHGLPVLAVNGDFYTFAGRPYAGDPRGLQIMEEELLSAPNGGLVFWMDPEGRPHATNVLSRFALTWPDGTVTPFGLNERRLTNTVVLYTPAAGRSTRTTNGTELFLEREGGGPWLPLRIGARLTARVREVAEKTNNKLPPDLMVLSIDPVQTNRIPTVSTGAVLTLTLATTPELQGVRTALGGGPMLVREGRPQDLDEPLFTGALPYEQRSMWERHPRTAFGWNDRYFYFVLADGRQKMLSRGMTLKELARYLAALGCREAMNLDGGGSSTMWFNGMVVNSPCDGMEREIGNALVVARKDTRAGKTGVANKTQGDL